MRFRLQRPQFRRQVVIGPYIVDFVCHKKKLIIELDGGRHLERPVYNKKRTCYLQSKGFRVVRFWNSDVLIYLEAVLEHIRRMCLN